MTAPAPSYRQDANDLPGLRHAHFSIIPSGYGSSYQVTGLSKYYSIRGEQSVPAARHPKIQFPLQLGTWSRRPVTWFFDCKHPVQLANFGTSAPASYRPFSVPCSPEVAGTGWARFRRAPRLPDSEASRRGHPNGHDCSPGSTVGVPTPIPAPPPPWPPPSPPSSPWPAGPWRRRPRRAPGRPDQPAPSPVWAHVAAPGRFGPLATADAPRHWGAAS